VCVSSDRGERLHVKPQLLVLPHGFCFKSLEADYLFVMHVTHNVLLLSFSKCVANYLFEFVVTDAESK